MTARVGPSASKGKPPKGKQIPRSESIHSIEYNDEALEADNVGGTPVDLDEETKWIRSNIKRRECKCFIPEIKSDALTKMTCQCGYSFADHSNKAQRQVSISEVKWDVKRHTAAVRNNAFGEIEFAGYSGNVGKYIRVDVDTSMSVMLELLMSKNVWGLDKPNLLISVTGGAKNFQMNKRLKETFRRGLMKTALTTGAWIMTGGTNVGVMKHVGEAVKDFGVASISKKPVIAIGIAPWGCVQNKDSLINHECTGLWPANYRIDKEQIQKESFLDPNHTHFILVDNGTEHKFTVEIPFRAQLEKEIAKMKTETGDNAVSVPIVLLVLEGGPGTLETVHQAIQNNTPAVIVKGSGRAADILAYAYQNAREEEYEIQDQKNIKQKKTRRLLEDQILLDVQAMVEKEFGNNEMSVHMNNEMSVHMDRIKDCLDKSDLMSVFEVDAKAGVREIDVAMLQALLKANKNQVMDQLRLALAWNRIDVAKSDIFTDEKRWPTGSLDDVMFSAILLNRVNFVELFLDHGVSLREFLTKKKLLMLYNKIPSNCLLRLLLKKVKDRYNKKHQNFSLVDVGLLIQSLMNDTFHPSYITKSEYKDDDVDAILKENEELIKKTHSSSALEKPDFENPAQELFVWSVLMLRQGMGKLFWAEGKDAIAAALVANSLLKALKLKTEDTELAIKIQEYLNEWSMLAVGVLSECYTTEEHKAQDLLVREQMNWGNSTCMLIAVKADNKEFISQTACQSLLNRIWMGKIASDTLTWRADNKPILIKQNTRMSMKGSNMSIATEDKVKVKDSSDMKGKIQYVRGIGDRLWYFFKAPVIIFMYNVLSYLVFLGLFTYVLIFDFHLNVSNAEIVLIVWVLTIFIEKIRQISRDLISHQQEQVSLSKSTSIIAKLQGYITDSWNIVDIVTIILFIVSMILRFVSANTFEAGKVFLALNFISFFLRLLHIFSVHKELGPKLVMIGQMIQDLMYFLVILMVFVVSYAIASHSILFPNSPNTWYTAIAVIRKAYWNIYGELFLSEIEDESDCTNEMSGMPGSQPRCPSSVGQIVVPIMMGVYMMLVNILLLNLLIAMFSYTFNKVQENTDKHWFFQRYSLIYEYYTRPVLCPPFSIISHIYLVLKFFVMCIFHCCNRCLRSKDEKRSHINLASLNGYWDDFRRRFKNERELVQWENVIADAFHHKTELRDIETMEFKVNRTHLLMLDLKYRIDEIQEQQQHHQVLPGQQVQTQIEMMPVSPKQVQIKMPEELDTRLKALEVQMDYTQKSLEWIIKAIQENRLSTGLHSPPEFPNVGKQKQEAIRKKEIKFLEEKQKVLDLIQHGIDTHIRSRQSPYLGSDIARFPVPDDKISWNVKFQEYAPNVYTAAEVLQRPPKSDPDIMQKKPHHRENTIEYFNKYDPVFDCNRQSLMGIYEVRNGLPLNPKGRTGLQGRGLLYRWGPNHAGDPIVTRWKMKDNEIMLKEGKPVLEFVAVMRSDNNMWALPGTILENGKSPADNLKAEFTEEALGTLNGAHDEKKSVKRKLRKLWRKGIKVYEGYADDPRNTDNAWLETVAVSYHDDMGTILNKFNLKAREMVQLASWLTLTHEVSLHGSHLFLLKLVADRLGAYF